MESAKTLDTDDSFVPVYKGHEFEAIKLQKGVYLQDRAINAKTTFRAWVHAYQLGLVVGYIGILILVFAVP